MKKGLFLKVQYKKIEAVLNSAFMSILHIFPQIYSLKICLQGHQHHKKLLKCR